jgi:hypothetical protein
MTISNVNPVDLSCCHNQNPLSLSTSIVIFNFLHCCCCPRPKWFSNKITKGQMIFKIDSGPCACRRWKIGLTSFEEIAQEAQALVSIFFSCSQYGQHACVLQATFPVPEECIFYCRKEDRIEWCLKVKTNCYDIIWGHYQKDMNKQWLAMDIICNLSSHFDKNVANVWYWITDTLSRTSWSKTGWRIMQARPDIIVANERLVTTKCCKRKISYYQKG